MRTTGNTHRVKSYSLLAGMLAAAMLVSAACQTAASPSAGTSGAPPTGQFCQGQKIVFFPGGTPGGGFETVVYNGAKAAEAAFGPTVTYQWSDWDPNKMITQFQEAVATKPNGIVVMGHPGDDAFDPLIDDARSQGILVTVMNTELPNAQAKYGTAGTGYVGAVLHDAGAALANEAIGRGGLQSGDRALVWGLVAQAGRGERTQGILDALEEAGLTVDYLEIDDATNADPAAGVSTFTGYASSHPDLKAIFIDHGNLTSTIPTYMKAANLDPGSIYAAGFDLSPATVQGVKDGYVNLVIDQQQYLQGFLGIQQICLSAKYGFSGLFVNTGGGFVDKDNIDVIEPLVTQQNSVTSPSGERSDTPAPPAVPQGRPGGADGGIASSPPARRLELRNISKSFGGVHVLRDVDFHLASGEVVGLLGDNGAGKSTLIKLITGVHQPDAGEILFGGEAVSGLNVQQARALGVETVFQERALAEQLPLWRNIFLGRPISGRLGFLKVGEMRRITSELMGESMGFTSAALTPDTSVIGLSGGERQGLAIVRALHFEADIIILDEPTMGLSLKETEKLLHFVDGIRTAGKSCIFIDHNIFHVYAVADRIVVLDRGRVAGEFPTSRYSLEELMSIMKEVAVSGAYAELDRYRAVAAEAGSTSNPPVPS